MSTGPQPLAEGSLTETPFAHVLVSIERRALSGTLAVWPDDAARGQDRIRFEEGRIVAARLLEPSSSLELGLLPLFRREVAPYAFYAEDLLGDVPGILRGRVHTGALIAAALRGPTREEVQGRILAAHGDRFVRLVPGVDVASLALLPKERAVLELLQAEPASVARTCALSGDAATARRVLYLLTLMNGLEAYEGPARRSREPEPMRPSSPGRPSGVPGTPPPPSPPPTQRTTPEPRPARSSAPGTPAAGPPKPPPPPPELASDLRVRWQEVADFIVAADHYNYFQVLGVGEAASADEIAAAYAKQAKRFHPDRLGPELAPLAPYCQQVFQQLTEAKKALAETDARLAHVRAIRSGGGTPAHDRKLSAIVGAAMEFQKVDVLVKQRKYDEALALLDRVLAIEPDEADYLARKAWVLFLVHPDKVGPRANEILALSDKALAKNDRHEQAHFTKASMRKRQGDMPGALEHFRLVLRANPKNIDAAREVRLADMRSKKGTSSFPPSAKSGEPGILKKLFRGGKDKP